MGDRTQQSKSGHFHNGVVDLHARVKPGEVHSTLRRHMLVDGFDFVLDLEQSRGCYLYDARTGERFVDFFTFFASNPIGMNHPKLNNPEFISQIGKLALHKPSNSDVYTIEMAEFVETFFKVAVPEEDFRYAFFIEGGALAVENALKTAFDWKVRKNFARGIEQEKGHRVLHLKEAFHGRSGYTMSLTNTDPNKVALFPKFDWPRVSNPAARFPLEGENLKETEEREKKALEEINETFDRYPDEIACIILEPIQGEGGDNHFRTEFLQELRKICDEREALLIFDEVQTGVGLTGTMWAYQGLGVRPDILSFGKKSQVCGILASERLDEVKENVFHKSGRINSTWGGNLVDMVRFAKILEVIDEENLVENARQVGAYILSKVERLALDFPDRVSNPRGRGLMCAFDMASHDMRNEFRKRAYKKGLVILGCGTHSIRFRPPLNITHEAVDEGFKIIRSVLEEL